MYYIGRTLPKWKGSETEFNKNGTMHSSYWHTEKVTKRLGIPSVNDTEFIFVSFSILKVLQTQRI